MEKGLYHVARSLLDETNHLDGYLLRSPRESLQHSGMGICVQCGAGSRYFEIDGTKAGDIIAGNWLFALEVKLKKKRASA